MMKLTNKMALEIALNAIENSTLANWYYTQGEDRLEVSKAEAMDKLTKMMEQLDKKASTEKKPTKTQLEADALADALYDEMLADGGKLTVSEMLAKFDCVKGMSNQKVSAIVRKLKDAGRVVKDVEGRKSLFSAVA
jgi:chaperonin cofactor prefoldin